ncbi:MAG: hypothetical protein ACPGXL_03890 [Chitinophagales bacterium]
MFYFSPKNICTLFCFLFFLLASSTNLVFAQGKEDIPLSLYEGSKKDMQKKLSGKARNFVGFSVGANLPQGEFVSVFDEERAGYAQTGLTASLAGSYLVYKNIGVQATLGMHRNNIVADEYEGYLLERLPDNALGALTTSAWKNIYFAVGPNISLPEDKVTFDLHLLFGLSFVQSPELNFAGTYNEDIIITDIRESASAVSFLSSLGGSVSFPLPMLDKDFKAFVKGEFVSTAPKLTINHVADGELYKVSSQEVFQQPVSVFSISAGLRYEFGYAKRR